MDCLFCKIIKGEIPANIIYRDENVVAFHDISPQAPHHLLIIPHKHIPTLNDLHAEDNELIGQMVLTAKMLAKQLEIDESGYRLNFNCKEYFTFIYIY
jgi:histidine triad (HIT) family protein